jgi:hypothetical protein
MKTVTFTREGLYDLVWKKNLGQIGHLYGLSSYGIRQACATLKVPLPHASYWIQLKHGYSWVAKLSESYEGPESIEILKKKYETNVPPPVASPIVLRTKEIEKDPKAPLTIGERLTKPHRLIQITKDRWDKRDKSKRYWEPDTEGISLHVADALKPRALRFMDGFIKLLEYRGHDFRKNQYGYTVAVVDGIEIEVDLREAGKRVPSNSGYGTEVVRTGVFIFQVGKRSDQKEWRDGNTPIEGLLARIVAKLELMAEIEKEQEEQRRLRQIEREKQEAIQRAAAARRQKEVQDFKALLHSAERFDEVTRLRNYVKAVQNRADALDEKTLQWIAWAQQKINWMDPLVGTPDEIFTEFDLTQYKKW